MAGSNVLRRGTMALQVLALLQVAIADNVLVRPWGDNALRIQISPSGWELTDALPNAYLPGGAPSDGLGPAVDASAKKHPGALGDPVISGNIQAHQDAHGFLVVTRVSDSKVLLRESERVCTSIRKALSVTFDFSSSATKLYGMGQNRRFNNGPGLGLNVIDAGSMYDFALALQKEGGPSNTLPWTIGAKPSAGGFQFGVLFNSPSVGSAMFNATTMRWSIIADNFDRHVRRQFDFLIITHAADAKPEEKPFQIIEKYVDAVGHARRQPYTGYWHSKHSYSSQKELLDAVRGFHDRSIPVDVIVIDGFHWKTLGDWEFDEALWPDPKAMVEECHSYGMELMVSVLPFSCPGSRSYATLIKNNWISTKWVHGSRSNVGVQTHGPRCLLVDATNPDFRKYAWSLMESGYYQYGIKMFALDVPGDMQPFSSSADSSFSAGTMEDLAAMYTLYWTQAFYDGLRSHGQTDIVTLPTSSWVGAWRYGAALSSGKIGASMQVLKGQINIGLSAQTSGIPWWTTDVGGYTGGKAEDPTYRETIVRWFQYGMTCPVFYQFGIRDHTTPWSYGAEDEKILADIIRLRAEMKPYFSSQLDKVNATGRPFNRPLMWDFPDDDKTWELAEQGIDDASTEGKTKGILEFQDPSADQYMMGDDYMVAPILHLGQRSRKVYFPRGADWVHHFTGQTYIGGTVRTVDAPLETFPLFKRSEPTWSARAEAFLLEGVLTAMSLKFQSGDILWIAPFMTMHVSAKDKLHTVLVYTGIEVFQGITAIYMSVDESRRDFFESLLDRVNDKTGTWSLAKLSNILSDMMLLIYATWLGYEYWFKKDTGTGGDGDQAREMETLNAHLPAEVVVDSEDECSYAQIPASPCLSHGNKGMSAKHAAKSRQVMCILCCIRPFDGLLDFVPPLVSKTFTWEQLMVGVILSAALSLMLCLFIGLYKQVADGMAKIPIFCIVSLVGSICILRDLGA